MEQKNKIKLPKFVYPFYIFGALCLILYIIAILHTPFADFINDNISPIFRGISATITSILPFSLAELIIVLIPVIAGIIIYFATKKYGNAWRDFFVFLGITLSIVCLFLGTFILSFGIGYYTSPLEEKLGIEQREVSKEELHKTALWLIDKVNNEIAGVEFEDKGPSHSPYSLKEINKHLLAGYDNLSAKYDFLPRLKSRIKPIMLSKPMTYTHISGVYTFFTGEANLNMNCPEYSLIFTAAHELAHQRGIAREDEANFIAFLVCAESNDQYIRYCGYQTLLEYVMNALYSADKKLWEETYKTLNHNSIYEMIASNEFYEPYRDNVVGDISQAVNDAYLQANGTEGSKSYGLVVDLAVSYVANASKTE